MRIQIYIPGKTPEDLALREALNNRTGPQLKELLALGLAAKNSTTKPKTRASTVDSGEPDVASSTEPERTLEGHEFSTTNFGTHSPEPIVEESIPPRFADPAQAAWASFVQTGELQPQKGNPSETK